MLHLTTWAKQKLPLVFSSVGIFLIILALCIEYTKIYQKTSSPVNTSKTQSFTVSEGDSFSRKILKIDIQGAIERPGVYEIPDDSRIQDVLITAGGLSAKANRMIVSRDINLAQRVYDGQKIYIPFESETSLPVGKAGNPVAQSASKSINSLNINTATESELDTLPGIGPVTASKIIAGRPYQNISELLTRRLISASVYDKIKNSITAY